MSAPAPAMRHFRSCRNCRHDGGQINYRRFGSTTAKPEHAASEGTPMQSKQYDRAAQDIGNIVNLGHVNVCISDQQSATHYYVTGLGLTRDPFLNTGAGNMWINVGVSQFHLPTNTPEILRGVIG